MGYDKEKRLKRRSRDAKALQLKQFRQQIINKKKRREAQEIAGEIQEQLRPVHERVERDGIPEQVSTPGSGDLEGPVRDPST